MMDALRTSIGVAAPFAPDMTTDAGGTGTADAFDAIFVSVSPAPAAAPSLTVGAADAHVSTVAQSIHGADGAAAFVAITPADVGCAGPSNDVRVIARDAVAPPRCGDVVSDDHAAMPAAAETAVAALDAEPSDPTPIGETIVEAAPDPVALPMTPHVVASPVAAAPVASPSAPASGSVSAGRPAHGTTMRAADGDDAPAVHRPGRRRVADDPDRPIAIVLHAPTPAEPVAAGGAAPMTRGPLRREATVAFTGRASAAAASGGFTAVASPPRETTGSVALAANVPNAGAAGDATADAAPALSALIAAAGLKDGASPPTSVRPSSDVVPSAAPANASADRTAAPPPAAAMAMPATMTMLAARHSGERAAVQTTVDAPPAADRVAPTAAAAADAGPGPAPTPRSDTTQMPATTLEPSDASAAATVPAPPARDPAPTVVPVASVAVDERRGSTVADVVAIDAPAAARAASPPVAPVVISVAPAATTAQTVPARPSRSRMAERPRAADPVAATTPTTAAAPIAATDPTPDAGTALAAGGADRAVAVARHAAWADGIARDIASAGGTDGTARFTVAPAALGTVSVEVSRSADGAAVRLVASSDAARDALDAARPQLVAEARAQGLHIRDAQVDLAGSSGGGTHRDPAPHQPVAVQSEPSRPASVVDANSLTTGAYGGAGGGEAGRQAQQHARPPAASPQTGAATARRATAPDPGPDTPRRAAAGRYA